MRFHDLKLRTKLILLVTGISAAAVVLLGTHVAGMQWFYQRQDVARTALAEADLVAQGTAAALAFDDPRAARENLGMFRAQPTVAGAAVYDRSGDLFAGYVRDGSPVPVPFPLPESVSSIPDEGFTTFVKGRGQVVAVVPVRLQGEVLGTVAVVADLSEAYHTLVAMARVAGVAIIVSLLLAVVLSIRLQRLVSGPILELADLTGRVSRERNYALRAPAGGGDELGLLAGNFNAMLGEIQTRDEALRRHREGLERTVAERTRELGRANARLTDELGERRRAEALVRGQNEALESLATGRPLADTLVVLCHFLEDQVADTHCAVMVRTPEGDRMRHAAAPSLPEGYVATLDVWPAGPDGVPVPMKADNRQPIWTLDIAASPLWADIGPTALAHGLRACWCMPVNSPQGELLGRISLYHETTVGEPTDPQHRLLETGAAIAGMAMERNRSEGALREAATVFESTLEAVVILDDRGRIVAVNRAFTEITGFPAGEVLGAGPTDLPFSVEGDDGRVWEALQGAGHWQDEVRGVRRDGTPFPAWLTVNTVRGPDGRATRYVALFSDITERKVAEERLARMALFDGLTGLANRRLFTDRLSQALGRARRQKGQVAVLFVDLDRFKPVNDSLGHAAGDEVLKAVSERVKGVLRQEDTLARLGGDEFTVILEDVTGREDAVRVAERLLEAVSAPLDLDGQEVAVGASIGISIYPDDGTDAAALVGSADMAMYRAKEAGRGVFCFFAGEMQDRVALRLRMDAALRHALERHEFRLVFQPQVEVRSGRLVGAEALLRWRHPELGDVPPDTFVPILEDTGLIFPVGEWVLAEACRQWHAWAAVGAGALRVAVNLSGRQLHRERLPELVRRVLADTALPAACLELELTESVVMEDAPATVETLNALQDLGVSLAVDDFGTGYSSLSYLKAFPIRALKIDRSFVRDINAAEGDRAIAGAVISLAHSLELNVVAEGVETEAQLAVLRGLECDLAQGYLFGRPMEADAFRRHLAERVVPRPVDACLPTPP